MASTLVCPLCTHPSFNTFESLCNSLITVTKRHITCPMCREVSEGLDKFTIHVLCHSVNKNRMLLSEVNNSLCASVEEENSSLISDKIINKSHCDDNLLNSRKPVEDYDSRPTYSPVSCIETCKFQVPQTIEHLKKISDVSDKCNFSNNSSLKLMYMHPCSSEKICSRGEILDTCSGGNSNSYNIDRNVGCNVCGLCFMTREILDLHQELIHLKPQSELSSATGNFSCFLCSKVFLKRGTLMVHLRVAHGIGKSILSKPLKGKHSERNGIFSPENQSLKKDCHLSQQKKTNDGKQHECDVCFKLFTTKYFLKKHKRLHTGETPYSCSQCSKTFTFQQSYHKHLLYHSNEKPHICSECDKAFRELSTLHNHQRIHTGEKPFACETCGKCFRQRVSYLVHKRIHTGVMPYKCTACGKTFRYKVSQKTHKCNSQPPGTVVRQTGDLIQKLLKQKMSLNADTCTSKCSDLQKQNITSSTLCQQFSEPSESSKNMLHPSSHVFKNICSVADNEISSVNSLLEINEPRQENEREESLKVNNCITQNKKDVFGNMSVLSTSNPSLMNQMENFSIASSSSYSDRSKENLLSLSDKCSFITESTDFFTMVMSPQTVSLPSTSEKLHQFSLPSVLFNDLALSHPEADVQHQVTKIGTGHMSVNGQLITQRQHLNEAIKNSAERNPDSGNEVQSGSIDGEKQENVQTLETINVESLKQMLNNYYI